MDTQSPMPTVSLSLTVKRAADALEFYKNAFGAEEKYRMSTPDGGVAHGEFQIGNTRIYISDEAEEWGAFAMPESATASCLFTIMTEDCDAAHQKALEAGATTVSPPTDQFWGMRSAVLRDPYGYRWSLGQITEQLSHEEIDRRARELFAGS